MADTDPPHPQGSPFWRFSLGFYRQPAVADACIRLQDEAGVDVNLLFYLLWHAALERSLTRADVAAIEARIAPWRDQVVAPLRAIRRAIKLPPPVIEAGTAEAYRTEHPFPYATLSQLVDHFDHVIALVGIARVGIGSDFDGVGDSLPEGIKDVSHYPALIEEFLRRGYTQEAIEAILGGNLMRVWRAVEEAAAAQPQPGPESVADDTDPVQPVRTAER